MRAGIYIGSSDAGSVVLHALGGLARQFLAAGWEVTIFGTGVPDGAHSGNRPECDLTGCRFACVRDPLQRLTDVLSPVAPRMARFLAGRTSLRFASGLDVFVSATAGTPPMCPATVGVLLVHGLPSPEDTVGTDPEGRPLRAADREKLARLRSWSMVWSPLEYCAHWARARWKTGAEVVPFPMWQSAETAQKRPMIVGLCTGRGDQRAAQARRFESVFDRMLAAGLQGWEFALSSDTDALACASIVWYSCGENAECYSCDRMLDSCLAVLVSSMASGAVPMVHTSAVPREIVRDGLSGLVWQDAADLQSKTMALAHCPDLLAKYSEAARARAREFSPGRFEQRAEELVGSIQAKVAA